MGRPFAGEIEYLPQAIAWALQQDIKQLQRAINSISERNLLAVGSGGSYSASVFLALQHEGRFGRLSRPITPLEYRVHSACLGGSATALISAEGKNKDILAAAQSMLHNDQPGFALTLTPSNPLIDYCYSTGAATIVPYDMPWGKDGFLATNSLVASMVLLTRAYAKNISETTLELSELNEAWISSRRQRIHNSPILEKFTPGRAVIVLFGGTGRVAATDVESKLTEAALATCQVVDYRQFAHGRHLQLRDTDSAPIIIAFTSASDKLLAKETLLLIPKHVPVLQLDLPEHPQIAEISGVIQAILLVDILAKIRGIDPGQPVVPQFARHLHTLDIAALVPEVVSGISIALRRKFSSNGLSSEEALCHATSGTTFCNQLAAARFKALVCDFDGTFCDTERRFEGLDQRLVPEVVRLVSEGIIITFATGRGDSLLTDLRKKLPAFIWPRIILGYYSGSLIARLDEDPVFPQSDSRFEGLVAWLQENGLMQQLETKPKQDCGQLGLRSGNQVARIRTLAAIRHWIDIHNLHGWRAYCSGHSIDVLTENVGKMRVVESVAQVAGAEKNSEILRLGDSGDFDGNDFEMLNEGLGLSVGSVSSIPEFCWNLLPSDRRGAVGTLYYISALTTENGVTKFCQEFIDRAGDSCFQNNPTRAQNN